MPQQHIRAHLDGAGIGHRPVGCTHEDGGLRQPAEGHGQRCQAVDQLDEAGLRIVLTQHGQSTPSSDPGVFVTPFGGGQVGEGAVDPCLLEFVAGGQSRCCPRRFRAVATSPRSIATIARLWQ